VEGDSIAGCKNGGKRRGMQGHAGTGGQGNLKKMSANLAGGRQDASGGRKG